MSIKIFSNSWFKELTKRGTPMAKYIGDNVAVNVNTGVSHHFDFPTKKYDTHNAVTVGTGLWKFVAPYDGVYSIMGHIRWTDDGTWLEGGHYLPVGAYKNGVLETQLNYLHGPGHDVYASNNFCGDIDLLAGEYLEIHGSQNSNSTKGLVTNSTQLWLSVNMIGRL